MSTATKVNVLIWAVAIINFVIGLTAGYLIGAGA